MFKFPFSLLTDVVVVHEKTKTGMGTVRDGDTRVVRVSIKYNPEMNFAKADARAVGQRGTRVTARAVTEMMKYRVIIISNEYLPIGTVCELPDGEFVEVKEILVMKRGRGITGFKSICW